MLEHALSPPGRTTCGRSSERREIKPSPPGDYQVAWVGLCSVFCRCDLLPIKHRGGDNLLNNACSAAGRSLRNTKCLGNAFERWCAATNGGFRGRGFHDKRPRVKWQLGDQEFAGRFLGSRVQIGLHSFTASALFPSFFFLSRRCLSPSPELYCNPFVWFLLCLLEALVLGSTDSNCRIDEQ